MGLKIQRNVTPKATIITTLIALFALVVQPLYGFVAAQVANAASISDHVVINEVMANPVAGEKEWVELYNPTASTVDLSNWRIKNDSNNFSNVFATGTSIAAHGYLVREAADTTSYLNDVSKTLSLQNDTAGTQIDQVTYSGIIEGKTYARSYDGATDWTAQATPTKGATNGSAPMAASPNTICDSGCQYMTLADAVAGAASGASLTLKQDQTLSSNVTINKPLTLDGESKYTIFVSGAGNRLTITQKTTLSNLNIVKTDKTGVQNIIALQADGSTIQNVHFTGQYAAGDGDVSRALEISANNFLVTNSTFTNLRQPAYINGFTGTVSNNVTSGTKGWVVTGNSQVTFTGNTWDNNATDIAIIDDDGNASTPATNNYPCNVVNAIKQNNANAAVDNQLLARPCAPNLATPTTEVVTDKAMNGWTALNDNGQGGTATFENGPAIPPKGNGSVQLTAANADSDFALATGAWNGTKLADIAALSYSSYKKSGASGPVAFALNFDTDVTDNNTAWQGRLTYEPTYANTTTNGEWQTFDHMMTDKAWWFSSDSVKAQLNCDDTVANLCTLDQIIAKFPKSGIHTTLGAVLLRVDGSWTDYAGNVDALTIATGTKNITYDFEPADTTVPTVPVSGAPNGTYIPTNDFDFTWDASTDVSGPVTYEFQSSQNAMATNGVLTTNLWKSGTLSEPKIHSSGAPDGTWYWQVRATDAAGNTSNWSQIWKVTLDTNKPIVAITAPTNGQFVSVRGTSNKLTITGTASDNSNFNYYYCYVTVTGHNEVGKRDPKCQTAWALGTPSKTAFTDTAQGTTNGTLGSVDLSGVANGDYTVHLVAKDKAGNTSETSTPFTLDNTRPTVQANPLSSMYNPATYSMTANDEDSFLNQVTAHVYNGANTTLIKSCSVNVRAMNVKSYTLHCDMSGLVDGPYTIRANASDAANNISPTDSSVHFTLDHHAPTATVTYSNNNGAAVTANDVTVTLKADEPIQTPAGWTKVDSTSFTKVYADNGKYSVEIEDLAGNKATVTYEVKRIDKVYPVITLSGTQVNGTYTSDVAYLVTEQSIRDIIIDGKTYSEKTAPKLVSGDGDHTIEVIDKAGNSTTVAFTIDSTAPRLTLNAPTLNNDGTYSVSGTTTDKTAPITLALNGEEVTPVVVAMMANADKTWNWTAQLGALTAGTTYTLSVSSKDAVNNSSTPVMQSYQTPAVQATPLVAFSGSTSTPSPLTQPRFVAVASTTASPETADSSDTAVLGTKTAKSDDTAVAGASDVAALAPSDQGWKIFGMAWYWWLLIVAAVIALVAWIVAAARRRAANV